MAASDVTLLPEPDSPTSPSTSPGAMLKLTSRTAYTSPVEEGKRTDRLRTSSRAMLESLQAPGSRHQLPLSPYWHMEPNRWYLLPQNQRQPTLAAANHNNLRIGTLR